MLTALPTPAIVRAGKSSPHLSLAWTFFSQSSHALLVLSPGRRVLLCNGAFTRHYGWSADDLKGMKADAFLALADDFGRLDHVWKSAMDSGHWEGEVMLRRDSGESAPAWMVVDAVRDPVHGRLSHYLLTCSAVSAHQAQQQRVHHFAFYDSLTQLPNRNLYIERLRLALAQASRAGGRVGVVFLDLDRFKHVNDTYGHHVGDQLVRSVGQRLLHAIRTGDTAARFGGDEFVLVINGAACKTEIQRAMTQRLLPLLAQPHDLGEHTVQVSSSVGIAVFPDDGADPDLLMRRADAAMFQSKAAGGNRTTCFQDKLETLDAGAESLRAALRTAIAHDELELVYQPTVDAGAGHCVGVEGLLRWNSPRFGRKLPHEFLPLADACGLMPAIGAWTLQAVCAQHRAWCDAGLGHIRISINLASMQLHDVDLPKTLFAHLDRFKVPPEAIELEVTEEFLVTGGLSSADTMDQLRAHGVRLTVDGFQAGMPMLAFLRRLPIGKLKFGQSLLNRMLDAPGRGDAMRKFVARSHELGFKVAAQRIESQEQADVLSRAGCDELQGFWLGAPMAADAIGPWLTEHAASQRASLPGERAPGSGQRASAQA